ncbi:MAG TPA: response regulator [Verrucomicrobiae bacterium]|jgi:CheY-like chemotaxis protein|nr:response regulator [Verrucomicrobiae bacterium]
MNDSATQAVTGSKKSILVVDDSASVAELISEMLLSFGYHPEICLTVKEALAKFEANKYDLVITDYTMPGMNGVDFAKLLKESAPSQIVLLITGSNFSMTEAASRSMPVNATLQKPFSVQEFQEAVANLIGDAKAHA